VIKVITIPATVTAPASKIAFSADWLRPRSLRD
jgi:hypothetical protein